MFQLIIAVLSIALVAMLSVVGINYIPVGHKASAEAENLVRASLSRLELTYDVATRANNGISPAVAAAAADGGFYNNFQPILKIIPAAPPGFTWSYGKQPNDGSPLANLNYFCLRSTTSSKDAFRGFRRARSAFSSSQMFIASSCGATVNGPESTTFPAPVAVTFFVSYVPGVS